jgi:glycosyltransferase involved in cell wall biosynthesis
MNAMNKQKLTSDLSVVIIAFNEEDNLERCLRSVEFAREIVVVDSFSQDSTVEIAHRFTDRVLQHSFLGHIEQKNYALGCALHEWVLALDADEEVTPELAAEISALDIGELSRIDGFWIKRRNLFVGKWMKHSGWHPSGRIRLFRRSKARWGGENPHDRVILTDPSRLAELSGHLLHYTSPNLERHVEKIQAYTSIMATAKFQRGVRCTNRDLWLRPAGEFLRLYALLQGFRDGRHGLVLCVSSLFYTFLTYAKLWELELSSSQVSADSEPPGQERS